MGMHKLRCSFCRKTEEQISKLVAGRRLIVGTKLYICNECVALANSIMQGDAPPTPTASRSPLQQVKECWHSLLRRRVSCEVSVAKAA
jgi:ATP-dependent protease Clp ATPase subunit